MTLGVPFAGCPAGGSIGPLLAHRHLCSKKCFVDFEGFFPQPPGKCSTLSYTPKSLQSFTPLVVRN